SSGMPQKRLCVIEINRGTRHENQTQARRPRSRGSKTPSCVKRLSSTRSIQPRSSGGGSAPSQRDALREFQRWRALPISSARAARSNLVSRPESINQAGRRSIVFQGGFRQRREAIQPEFPPDSSSDRYLNVDSVHLEGVLLAI